MKSPIISALTIIFTVLGLSQQAKAYNLEACAKDPMTTKPETINLLQPIDQKMVNCIPKLDSIANQWQSKANSILSALNGLKIVDILPPLYSVLRIQRWEDVKEEKKCLIQ